MSIEAPKETLEFQTEVRQLLQLMIHSLYSNKEIFLRELISNASDACDKLRFDALKDDSLLAGDSNFRVRIQFDKDARTITISDNGIGMSREEVMENIGTIAKSGTRQFFEALTGDEGRDMELIGQFGVGFYSSFIVSDKVTLVTRRAGTKPEEAVCWISDGEGSYTLEAAEKDGRGTDVTLHLRESEDEFLDAYRLRSIVKKYSEHISVPIEMAALEEDKENEYETINDATALWKQPKKDISEEEYKQFYKHVAHDFDEPLAWIHNQVEGNQSYSTLFYIPRNAPFDLWDRDHQHGIKLYVRRVFIMDDAEHLMPHYLRFVRGLVDSDDLPLNVSREILQKNKFIDSIRAASVKKILGLLESMAKNEAEKYAQFWTQFGRVLKEGPAEDFSNKERVAGLLRFSSNQSEGDEETTSLSDYTSRMQSGQDKIYYVTADSLKTARNSPHLEIFRKKGIEVLLLHDRVDEWLVSHLTEFDGKKLVSVAKGDLDLGELKDEKDEQEIKEAETQHKDFLERINKALEDEVSDVHISQRLIDSPSCLVMGEHDMAMHMQKLFQQAGHEMPANKPVLEVNLGHPLVKRLEQEQDDTRFEEWSRLLFEQGTLSEGGQLDDPVAFVKRMNSILLELADNGN